jgi:hypothetical protein
VTRLLVKARHYSNVPAHSLSWCSLPAVKPCGDHVAQQPRIVVAFNWHRCKPSRVRLTTFEASRHNCNVQLADSDSIVATGDAQHC